GSSAIPTAGSLPLFGDMFPRYGVSDARQSSPSNGVFPFLCLDRRPWYPLRIAPTTPILEPPPIPPAWIRLGQGLVIARHDRESVAAFDDLVGVVRQCSNVVA